MEEARPRLLIAADDYGYSPPYDEGILEAAAGRAIDTVGVMVLRSPAPDPLVATGVELGLHLEPVSSAPLRAQLDAFAALFGGAPRFIDGHKHCHAEPPEVALAVAEVARERGIRVRSVDPTHRDLLRSQGVLTPDRLVGRTGEDEPLPPPEIDAWLGGAPPRGLTEWMVHPGRAGGGSSYDRGREEDLELVLRLAEEPLLLAARPPF